jgi:SOS response regulatory protein OraA/RecX
MGKERLKAELLAKGISDVVANRVIADTFREVSEEILAHRAIQVADRRGSRLTLYQLARLLHQRGFREEVVDRMMTGFRGSEESIDEE